MDDQEPQVKNNQNEVQSLIEQTQQSLVHNQDMAVPNQPKNERNKIIIALVVLFAALIIAVGFYWWWSRQKTDNFIEKPTPVANVKPKANADTQLEKFIHPTTGEKWYSVPKKLGDLKLIATTKVGDSYEDEPTKFFEVGARGPNKIIIGVTAEIGYDNIYIFEQDPSGRVTYIVNPSGPNSPENIEYSTANLIKSVALDRETHYDSLIPPKSFKINKTEEVTGVYDKGSNAAKLGDLISDYSYEGEKRSVVKTYGDSKLIRAEHPYVDTKLTTIAYFLETPINTRINLTYAPIAKDLSNYSWDNGVAVKEDHRYPAPSTTMHPIIRGCGSHAGAVSRADGVNNSDFVQVGQSSDDQAVYAFKDSNNEIIKKAYSEFLEDLKSYSQASPKVPLALEDFISQHGVVVYKNAAGEWLVYRRDNFSPMGGCAKPVVYLYPTKPTNVNVRLGAKVKISEPLYNSKSGWNIRALPNGQLILGNKIYSSLFWEGTGVGPYPAITTGTVVKHNEVVATIRKQMAQQGLTAQETSDFIDYWQDKIPNKPFVRLTWFNTAQLNQLAPLRVFPKPDTVIRVFLDMDGLDKKIVIPKQIFKKVPRIGFTVVEWGGLTNTGLK